eukprot:TRINITY_DN4372_c0_g1_i1.p1 TRINITY_DN4372_c0_g1~~TRINITY_DN4372_c0_g1_i1.p1  ORF type:complete len:204 (+),score=59.36 TRINITY_DN4372_c0_g1_i1:86-697(+)
MYKRIRKARGDPVKKKKEEEHENADSDNDVSHVDGQEDNSVDSDGNMSDDGGSEIDSDDDVSRSGDLHAGGVDLSAVYSDDTSVGVGLLTETELEDGDDDEDQDYQCTACPEKVLVTLSDVQAHINSKAHKRKVRYLKKLQLQGDAESLKRKKDKNAKKRERRMERKKAGTKTNAATQLVEKEAATPTKKRRTSVKSNTGESA